MMKYSPSYFKETMPEWKRKKDSIVARYIHRPISFVFSSVFAEIGMTPNQVSFISLIIAIVSCIFFMTCGRIECIIGAVLVNLWSITDSADGNMARSIGGKPYGDFIDATSSYFLVGFLMPILGWVSYNSGGIIFKRYDGIIILLGCFAGVCDTMTRLFFQKMKCNTFEIAMKSKNNDITEDKSIGNSGAIAKIHTIIESEFGLGGWNMIAIVLCSVYMSFDLYILFYLFFYGCLFILSTIYLIKKTRCLSSSI